MTFGGIKNYNLIHLDFTNYTYGIYSYQKDRRLTAKQAWNIINHTEPLIKGELSVKATIFDFEKIVEKYELNIKYCDRYSSHKGFD